MDGKYPDQRIKRAEKLRKRHGRLWGYFFEPDYYGSAELFSEVADEAADLEEKEALYNEAATTFLMKEGEYSFYRAAEIYRKLMHLYKKASNEDKTIEYGILYATNLEDSERYMLSGQAFADVAALYEKGCPVDAIKHYETAIRLYGKDGSCPFHMKKAQERCLMLQIQQDNFGDAIESLARLNIKYSGLCRQILCILCQSNLDDDLDDPAEHQLVMALINSSKEEGIQALEGFSNNNFLPDYAQLIFEKAVENLKPENDIC